MSSGNPGIARDKIDEAVEVLDVEDEASDDWSSSEIRVISPVEKKSGRVS